MKFIIFFIITLLHKLILKINDSFCFIIIKLTLVYWSLYKILKEFAWNIFLFFLKNIKKIKVYKILLLFIIIFLIYKYFGFKIIFFLISLLISFINKQNFYSIFYMIKNFIIKNFLKNLLFFLLTLNFDINSIIMYLTNDILVDKVNTKDTNINIKDQDKEYNNKEQEKKNHDASKKRILIVIVLYIASLVFIYWFIQNGGGPPPFDINQSDLQNINISTNDKPPPLISMLDNFEKGYDSQQARAAWYSEHPDYVSSESTESNTEDSSNTYDYVDPVLDAYVDADSTDESSKNDEM